MNTAVSMEHEEPIGREAIRTRRVPEPPLRVVDNPILIAQARRRLRQKQVVPGVLITGILGLCGVLFAAAAKDGHDAWRGLMYTALAAIGVIIGLRGTMQTSTAIADERRSGILDFHRATPTTKWTDTIGYLLGSAAREYLFAAVLVPFALLGALLGGVSPVNLVLALAALVLTGLLYQTAGLLSGLSIDNRRGVSGGVVALVVLAQSMALPLFKSGFVTLAYLTPYPVLARLLNLDATERDFVGLGQSVPFYGVPLHPLLFTVLVQGSILAFLLWASARKIHREGAAAFSRVGAAAFFGLLLFLSFGGAWGTLTSELKHGAMALIAGAYINTAMITATVLLLALTPSYIEFLRALRRARRHGQAEAAWLADGGPSWPLIGVFAGLVVGGLVLLALVMKVPGLLSLDTGLCVVAVVSFLALVTSGSEYTRLMQRKSARNSGILIFFLTMVLPWLLFGVAEAAHVGHQSSLFLGALSPAFAIGGAGLRMAAAWGGEPFTDFGSGHLYLSLAVTLGLAGWFLLQTRSLQQALAEKIPLGQPAGRR